MKSRNLEEANIALKVLLKHREDDKNEIEDTIIDNIKQLIVPYMEKLRMSGLGLASEHLYGHPGDAHRGNCFALFE